MAAACVVLAVLGGAFGALHYIPGAAEVLQGLGLGFTALRPLHTTFAHFWIYASNVAVIYYFLAQRDGDFTCGEWRRFRFHTLLWLTAAIGILISLPAGITSGREYLGFHPVFSVLLLAGWLAFAWTFYSRIWRGFFSQPVYVYMWGVGVAYFVYTFVEGHAHLLPFIREYPVVDLQIQWKSCGALVGSFNFLMYGSLMYVGERISGDTRYSRSTTAFSLFVVGCLNSFTNYAHHTYHLPQNDLIKWIAFVVSMTEIVILLRVASDIVKLVRAKVAEPHASGASHFFASCKWWTLYMLFSAILISVPNLNSLIHGTHVVLAHGMGSELGIDTMALLGAVAFLLHDLQTRFVVAPAALSAPRIRLRLRLLNLSAFVLVTWLLVSGAVHGVYRYFGEPDPAWVASGRSVFFFSGAAVGLALLSLFALWVRPLLLQGVPPGQLPGKRRAMARGGPLAAEPAAARS